MKQAAAEPATLADPRMREVNARHGDDHGVNLTTLRAVAKRLKTQHVPKSAHAEEPPNCTSPFAPIWITEMVSRAEAARG